MRTTMRMFGLFTLAALGLASRAQAAADTLIQPTDLSDSWKFSVDAADSANIRYPNAGKAVVQVVKADAQAWHIQLSKSGLKLDSGTTYTISFRAWASRSAKLNGGMNASKDGTVWSWQGGFDQTLTTSPVRYTVKVTDTTTTASGGYLQFNFGGGDSATVTIDSVVLFNASSNVSAGSELLTNGDFSAGGSGWSKSVTTGNAATIDYASGAAAVTVTQWDGKNDWSIQLTQSSLPLKDGSTYIVTFDASSTVARTLKVGLNEATNWKEQSNQSISLTTAKKSYSIKLSSGVASSVGVLQFDLGGALSTITIDNVSMKEQITSGGVVLVPKDTIVPNAPSNLPGYRVKGRFLVSPKGDTVVLRGINEMFVWGDPQGATLPEIAKTGANCVRIVWTVKDGTPAGLDTLIARAVRNKLIPIVEFHDATGKWDGLPALANAWAGAYLPVIQKHEKYLIVNIGNEVGDNSVTATDYVAGYDSLVAKLRHAGVRVPLMLDAAGYGASYDLISKTAKTLLVHDSLHNILNAVHMWWPLKNYGTKAAVVAKIQAAIADAVQYDIPLVVSEFGEAFTSTDVTTAVTASDSIPFRTILSECQTNRVGWLAWSWGKVPNNPQVDLNMTTDGTFAGLQSWGLEVAVSDPNSIKNTSKLSGYLADGVDAGLFPSDGSGTGIRSTDASNRSGFALRRSADRIELVSPVAGSVQWLSVDGSVLESASLHAGLNVLALPSQGRGMWILRETRTGQTWKIPSL